MSSRCVNGKPRQSWAVKNDTRYMPTCHTLKTFKITVRWKRFTSSLDDYGDSKWEKFVGIQLTWVDRVVYEEKNMNFVSKKQEGLFDTPADKKWTLIITFNNPLIPCFAFMCQSILFGSCDMHLSSGEGRFIARKTLHLCRITSPKRGPYTYSIFHLNWIPFIVNWLDNWFHLTYGQAYVKVVLYTQNWLSDVVMLQNQHIFGVAMFSELWNSICLSSSSSYSSATQTVSRRTVPPKRFWLNYCFKENKQFIW